MRLFGKEILAGFKQWGQVCEVLMLISGWRLVQRSRATEIRLLIFQQEVLAGSI